MITALCGGVGGSKLAWGLYSVLGPDTLRVVVNTADDLEIWGLHVSPDLDTVTYTLAGMARRDVGWGIEGDTFSALGMLRTYGAPSWFQVGDKDLATDVFRTQALREGRTLTAITAEIAGRLDVRAQILPMTDDPVATQLRTAGHWLDFQEYFVRERHAVPISEVRYEGVGSAEPTPRVIDALSQADAIVLVNSNPVLSILPIISLPRIRPLLAARSAPCVAVSPIIGSSAVSGPAGELMRLAGHASTATGVASAYGGIIDGIVIDTQDKDQASAIEGRGVRVLCTQTIMRTTEDRMRLANETLDFARQLR